MSGNTDLSRALKARAAAREAILLPGAANALTARLIEAAGFEAIYVTGAGIANFNFGVPDIGLVTLTEVADTVAAIRDCVSVPIMVDADTGFGNAVNMYRTIRVLERAGANAIQIEDQVFPKKCGHFRGKGVISLAEATEKVKAALDARESADLMIVARTDARAIDGFEAAVDRARAFIEAGADVTFVEAPVSEDELARIPAALPVPQVANIVHGGNTPALGRDKLRAMGFSMVLYANAALQTAVRAMSTMLASLNETGSLAAAADMLATFEERQAAVNKPYYDALEARYRVD